MKGFFVPNRRGVGLIVSIIMLTFALVAVLGTTVFILERMRSDAVNRVHASCRYLAYAGVNRAVYSYRQNDIAANGYFSLGTTLVDPGLWFRLDGTAGELLMVDTSAALIAGAGNTDLQGLTIQNAVNSKTIIIDQMVVTWNNTRRLRQILINGQRVFTGNLASPASANITNFTLNRTPAIYPVTRLRFNGSMLGAVVSIQFVMTDGSSRSLTVLPASRRKVFTVRSTGSTPLAALTVAADYNALTGTIPSYRLVTR